MTNQKPIIAFFGGEPLGLPALQALVNAGLTPSLVVCNPDRPAGRGQKLLPPPIKVWAEAHGLEVFQPLSCKQKDVLSRITDASWDLFIVVAYNSILPRWFLDIPTHGVINVHPSVLPKLRGASPIRSAILDDKRDEVGVSIMLMDEAMDHGPLLAQEAVPINDATWPVAGPTLDELLAQKGSELLVTTVREWLTGAITPVPQDHGAATYTKKFEKADAELRLNPLSLPTGEEAHAIFRRIQAFAGINDCFFFVDGKRIKIKSAKLTENNELELLTVVPEGKKEMSFSDYLKNR